MADWAGGAGQRRPQGNGRQAELWRVTPAPAPAPTLSLVYVTRSPRHAKCSQLPHTCSRRVWRAPEGPAGGVGSAAQRARHTAAPQLPHSEQRVPAHRARRGARAAGAAAHLLAAGVARAADRVGWVGGAGPGGERLGPVVLAGPRQHGVPELGDFLQLVCRRRERDERRGEGRAALRRRAAAAAVVASGGACAIPCRLLLSPGAQQAASGSGRAWLGEGGSPARAERQQQAGARQTAIQARHGASNRPIRREQAGSSEWGLKRAGERRLAGPQSSVPAPAELHSARNAFRARRRACSELSRCRRGRRRLGWTDASASCTLLLRCSCSC